jgi:catabolite regulation protein CreA
VAIADWFHPPEIVEVDLGGWTGKAGETIRVKAVDDVQVKQVTVVITDEADVLLEQGAAVREDALWWEYSTTAEASDNAKVVVAAEDLPGHVARAVQER